jgi:DNA-binding transcriptional ArsR family regulator
MSTIEHEHPVDPARVDTARAALISAEEAARLAGLLGLLSDPVRSRILIALGSAQRLCVGDLALALEVSEDAVSYALKLLRTAGLVTFQKEGRIVFYQLAARFPHELAEHCLRQLLSITEDAER